MLGKYTFDTSIVEISNKDPNTREVTLIAHKLDIANSNGLDFKEEYTKTHMNSLINKPLVCSYYAVSDDLGTHEEIRDQNGKIVELRTLAIGTITDVWIDDLETNDGTSRALYCKGKVWSYKYPQIMNCIENAYNSRNQTSSIEVEIFEYEPNPTMQYRAAKEYSYLGLCLLSRNVQPADKDSGVVSIFQKEVAMAINSDLGLGLNINTNEGGKVVSEKEVQFNYGKEMNIHFELSAMSHDDIRSALWNSVNPKDSDGNRDYKYWVRDVFNSYVIVSNYETDESFKMNYSINETENTISIDKESATKVKQEWVEINSISTEVSTEDLEKQIEDLKTEVSTKEDTIKELQTKIEDLEKEISTKNESLKMTETESNEKILKLGEALTELKTQIAELQPIKEQYNVLQQENIEKETAQKREVLKQFALNSKLISEKEIEEDETIKSMIEACNESGIKGLIADRIVESAMIETNTAKDDVVVHAKTPESLIPKTAKDEMFAPVGRK